MARYNYLTCMENRTRLLAKELGREGATVVESTENWRPFLKMTVDWDERNWHRDGVAAPEENTAPQPPPPPGDEELWLQTPFGYWVPLDGNAKHIEKYFDTEGSNAATVLRAWFATYPREVWRRF